MPFGNLSVQLSLSPKGNPPALLEDSRSLTTPGVAESLELVNRSKFTKGDSNECLRDSETYDMGMQIPCGVHSEVSAQKDIWVIAARAWRGVPRLGSAERERSVGGAFDGRSRAHAHIDTAEVCGIAGDGIHQRQERDLHRAGSWGKKAQLRGAKLLGARVLGFNGWEKRSCGASLHPRAGKGRPTFGCTGGDGALSASR